jgi:hypothetical protein
MAKSQGPNMNQTSAVRADNDNTGYRVELARLVQLSDQVAAFSSRWPTPVERAQELSFSWDALERQLADLAVSPTQAEMTHHLVSAVRSLAAMQPPEMVLRDILVIAGVMLDDTFLNTVAAEQVQ